ncbi:MAG: outer membrane beta-barrel protein [Muribaculaceae bacterium]|nr:outer membrane beta-barrel protein [Muribaculaceae bacterium]
MHTTYNTNIGLRSAVVIAALGLGGLFGEVAAKNVVVLSAGDNTPVESAVITMYDAQRDSVGSVVSDINGVSTVTPQSRYVHAEHDLYVPHLFTLTDGEATDTLRLKKATEIEELVVQGSTMTEKGVCRSYIIPRDNMRRYINVFQSLNEIPNLVVLPNNEIFYQGKGGVKLLLNGIDSSITEIRALDKDDISKVEVYSTAPARYMVEGYNSVVDIITKSSLVGGNASISINQAPYPLWGDNSAAIFYNYKRSRFSAIYSNENSHGIPSKDIQSDFLDYEFDGVKYYKHRQGIEENSDYDTNNLTLGYMLSDPESYTYSVKLSGGMTRDSENNLQRVVSQSNPTPYDARNLLSTSTDNIALSNYFEKKLGEGSKNGLLVSNLVLQRANSSYFSGYKEFEAGMSAPTIDETSQYAIQFSKIVGTVLYYMPRQKWGNMSFNIYDSFAYSRYREATVQTSQRVNTLGMWAQYYNYFGKFICVVVAGAENQYTYASVNAGKENLWHPTISANLYYDPSPRIRLSASYSYSNRAPSIAQLSTTYQWIDTKLIFHGNPGLNSYSLNNLDLKANYSHKYLNFSVGVGYMNNPGYICENFQEGPDYMLQTIINLDKYQELSGNFSMTVKPLGSTIWTIFARVGGGLLKGSSPTYDWTGYRFQMQASTSVNLDKWSFSANYQFPGKVVEGQLIRPRTEDWSISGYYRPKENLSVGLSIKCPFGKGWKESERTVEESPVQMRNESEVRYMANLVRLQFEWNVSFGKNQKRPQQLFDSTSNENGILHK